MQTLSYKKTNKICLGEPTSDI